MLPKRSLSEPDMPAVITRGTFSAKAFGFTGRTAAPVYVEDVFSTYLYTGTGAAQTITNNIDLSTKGGLVWIKQRSGAQDHTIFDTARGVNNYIRSNTTGAQNSGGTYTDLLTAFGTTGFTLGADASTAGFVNASGQTYVSWTFREQPKFFDVVTYTGTGSARTIAHNLGATPGMIIVKRTDAASQWYIYHTSLPSALFYLAVNTIAAQSSSGGATLWNSTAPTSSVFSVGTAADVNASGGTYVAYIFANQAGGFGLSGSDSVVACGGYTGTGASGNFINLGWEPQFVMVKVASGSTGNWLIIDNMRGFSDTSSALLIPNLTNAEASGIYAFPNATGFTLQSTGAALNASGNTYIYLAIRRGPMKVPTSGTSVYSAYSASSSGSINYDSQAYYYDLGVIQNRDGSYGATWADRLRGIGVANTSGTVTTNATSLVSSGTAAESTSSNLVQSASGGFTSPSAGGNRVFWLLRRAPGYMDEVCYTGTGVARTVAHNLGVVPELMIVKQRSAAGTEWCVYSKSITNSQILQLESTTAVVNVGNICWNSTNPTASVFSLGNYSGINGSGASFVAYLFATCPGVSKVGSYTGTGAAQNIDCGFSAGSRFVLIKRTDSTGSWYVYDSARGISSSSDPYLLWNSAAAQVTGTNYVDTFASGFALTATAPAGLNANGGSYIFLAIA